MDAPAGPFSILHVGGLPPYVSQEQLHEAFKPIVVYASSITREADGKRCLGHAYVTVATADVEAAQRVTAVANNHVCVLPVTLEVYALHGESDEEDNEDGGYDAAASEHEAVGPAPSPLPYGVSVNGQRAAAGGYSAAHHAPAPLAPQPQPQPQQPLYAAPGPQPAFVGLPVTGGGHVHLTRAIELLRTQLAANPRLAWNGRPWFQLLNELAVKRGMALQAAESRDLLLPHGYAVTLTTVAGATYTARGSANSKQAAKHAAAAAALDTLLGAGELPPADLVAAMCGTAAVQVPPVTAALTGGGAVAALPNALDAAAAAGAVATAGGSAGVGVGGGFGGGLAAVAAAASPAAAVAAAQTAAIMGLGLFPRTAIAMSLVHASDGGAAKTVLMVLQEHAVRHGLTVQHEEAPAGAAGPFRCTTRLLEAATGAMVAVASGVEMRSKQEAKQTAAAGVLEDLLARGLATAASLAGRKF